MAVKAAFILCLVLYKLTSGIKFAGEDCTENEHCAQKDYSSKCVCDFSTDEATGEKFFKRGLCMDDPPDSGSCMTKYKWAKIKDKKKPTGPTGGKYLGETCTKKTDCLKTGDRGCTCPKGKCFGKNCKIKMAYKGETCKLKNDCFNSHGSRCTCPRNKCFGVQCMTEEQAKKASIPKATEKKLVTKNVLAKSVPKVKAKKLVTKKSNSNVKSTSGIKFAGGDCTKNEHCAQKEYSSKCVCDFSSDKDTGEKFFKRGLCMDDPPFSGSCMTKYKWGKIKNKKKPTGPTGGKYLGESCTKKTDCLKTGDRGCTCPKGKCFGKNCMTEEQAKKASIPKVKEKKLVTKNVPKVKAKKLVTKKLNSNVKSTSGIKFAGGDCTKNEDCAQKEYSSKCVCDFSSDKDTGEKFFKRGLCMDDPPFSGSCMTKYKWAKIKNKKKFTGPTGGKYLGETCTKKIDCLKTGDRGCTCPKGKCFGKNCMTKEQAKKASVPKVNEKKLVTKKSYSDVKKQGVKDLVKKFSGGGGKKGKKGRNQKCKKSKECMSGCKCLPWRGWKMKKCQGVCKKASYAGQFGDFGDEMYVENDEMGYGIGFSVFIGIVSLCFCGVMAVVMGVITVIGWYLGIYVGEYGEKSGYNKLSQRGDVNDVEHNDA